MTRLILMRFRLLFVAPWRQMGVLLRTRDWWEHKLACFLGTAYAIAFHHQVPFSVLWPLLLVMGLGVYACAGYVSVINDITDRADDDKAGKPNNMTGRSNLFQASAVIFCLLAGLVAGWLMRNCPFTLSLYALNWLAFTLYSTPPFRLKTKGGWGVLADTCGGQFLPTLWVAMWVVESTHRTMDKYVAIPLVFWSFALGLRGILSHQLRDAANDRVAQVGTMVNRYGAVFASRLVLWVIFPVETVALFCLLARFNTLLAWLILALHLLVESRLGDFPLMWKALRRPSPRFWLPLAEYYKFYYPVTFILALASRESAALGLLALHFLLFPRCGRQFRRALAQLLRPPARRLQTTSLIEVGENE